MKCKNNFFKKLSFTFCQAWRNRLWKQLMVVICLVKKVHRGVLCMLMHFCELNSNERVLSVILCKISVMLTLMHTIETEVSLKQYYRVNQVRKALTPHSLPHCHFPPLHHTKNGWLSKPKSMWLIVSKGKMAFDASVGMVTWAVWKIKQDGEYFMPFSIENNVNLIQNNVNIILWIISVITMKAKWKISKEMNANGQYFLHLW